MSRTEVSIGRAVKCSNCGATLEITPDALAYICRYCGWVNTTEDISARGFLMAEPVSSSAVQSSFSEYLKKNLKYAYTQSQVAEFKALAIPIWIAKVHAHTRYNGYRQETRTETYPVTVRDGRGTRTETRVKSYPVYVPVRGEFDEVLTYPILGRRHAVFFGLEEVKKRVAIVEAKPLDVKVLLSQRAECLNVEVEESEARAMAESLAEDEHRARAEAMTTRLFDCYTDDEVLSASLVFYPVCYAKYTYRGKSFRAALDGVTGDTVKAELPVTLGLRIGYAALGYAGIALSALSPILLEASGSLEAVIIPMAAGVGITLFSFIRATAEQRVKRG